jgi:NSS family neurotransmitter:Na+ symporter
MDEREQWGTRLGFIFAAMGSAVGLGNIWRFPYMAYGHGGGAFLVPYLVALFVVGIPLMMLEFGLGHWARSGAPQALAKIHPRFSWIGWWAVTFVMFGIVVYYAVVIGWCLCYFVASFTRAWGEQPVAYFKKLIVTTETLYDAEAKEFVFGAMNWRVVGALAVVWVLNWSITFFGIKRGVERANKIFIPLLIVLVGVLVVWSFTFTGASRGIRFYLNPDWSVLQKPDVWTAAFTQIFFTLSLGFGIMIAYASYLPRESDIPMDAFLTSVGNCGFSIFAGFAVFCTIGYLAQSYGVEVAQLEGALAKENLSLQGGGLVFMTYPVVLNKIAGGAFFGVIFFLALTMAGLSSSISIVEAFTTATLDRFKLPRRVVVSILCTVGFLGGLVFCTGSGAYLLDVVDGFLTTYGLTLVALIECLIVGWYFGPRRLRAHLDDAAGMRFRGWTGTLMRGLIVATLAITWYGLAVKVEPTVGGQVVSFLLLGGVLLVLLDEHWLDVDIKIVIPALLLYLVNTNLVSRVTAMAETPDPPALYFGVGWVVGTLAIAFIIDALFRARAEPEALDPQDQRDDLDRA